MIWDENEGKWKHVDAETIYAVPYDVPVIGNDTVIQILCVYGQLNQVKISQVIMISKDISKM